MILNFESYITLLEEEVGKDRTGGDPDSPWFIILLGGSGTGKGSLVSTGKAIGEIGDYLGGKTFSAEALRKKVESGKDHIRSVFEPDRILRLVQHEAAADDYKKISTADPKKQLKQTLDAVLGEALGELKDHIMERCGGPDATVADFLEEYPDPESYAGKTYKPDNEIEAVDLMDALDSKEAGGDQTVRSLYMQMRKRQSPVSGGVSLKEYAVGKANTLIKDHLAEFNKVFGGKKKEAEIKMGSVILDSAGEDLSKQPVKEQLMAAKSAGFNTMIVLLGNGPVQSFIGNVFRKIGRAQRGVPSDEIMSFYDILPEKHAEFKKLGRVDPKMGYALLDGYKILQLDAVQPDELEGILRSICIGDEKTKSYGPIKKDKVICNDPDGDCIAADAYPDYLTAELKDRVDAVNKDTEKLKDKEKPVPTWGEVYDNPDERTKDALVVQGKISAVTKRNPGAEAMPLDVVDGFSKEADELFKEWEEIVRRAKEEGRGYGNIWGKKIKEDHMQERRVLTFDGFMRMFEKYGEEPFHLVKNGDTYNYFFKIESEKGERGFVLTVNKTHTVGGTHQGEDKEYCVMRVMELGADELDQAVVDQGKFEPNKNLIEAKEPELVRLLSSVADCMADYLEENAAVEKVYDEMPLLLKAQNYEEKMQVSFDKWPGESWNIQEVEPGKLNVITR